MTACLAWASTVSAQTQSLFGNRGPSSQIGSNLRGSITGGTTTFGSLGGQQVGGSQLGGTNTATQGGFVGRDDNTGRFVGDQRGTPQQSQGGGGRQFGNRGGGNRATGRAFGDGGQFGGRGNQGSARRIVRPRQEIAFTYRRPETSQINSSLRIRFQQISLRQPALRSVLVVLDEQGAATLTGQVNSAETMRLAAIMVRLEPGVRSIKNELIVGESPTGQ